MSQRKYYKEILPNLYYFREGQMLDCNMYLIKDDENNLCLIDAGNGLSMKNLLSAIDDLGFNIQNLKKINYSVRKNPLVFDKSAQDIRELNREK